MITLPTVSPPLIISERLADFSQICLSVEVTMIKIQKKKRKSIVGWRRQVHIKASVEHKAVVTTH